MSQVRPFRKWAKRSKYCTSRLASSVSRLSFRRLQYETLEARQLLSAANPAQQLTLADLPVAAHEAISAADQFTYISTTKGASASLLAGRASTAGLAYTFPDGPVSTAEAADAALMLLLEETSWFDK